MNIFYEKIYIFAKQNRLAIFFIFLIFFAFIYLYFSTQGTYVLHENNQGTYYNWLAQQFYLGHVGVPYLPGQYVGDFSHYKGVRYLYFGPLPAVIHFIYLKIVGRIIYGSILTYIFALLNLLAFWLIIIKIKTTYFQKKSLLPEGILFMSYAIGPLMFCMGRPFVYEEAIIVGSTCVLFSLYFALLAFINENKIINLLVSSVFLSFAFLSRITLVMYGITTCILAVTSTFKKINQHKQKRYKTISIIVFFIPILIGASAYSIYNYNRFGSIFDTGFNHVSSGIPEEITRFSIGKGTSFKYIPYNAYEYFIAWPRIGFHPTDNLYNRFVNVIGDFPKLTSSEYTSSVFLKSPLSLFALYLIILFLMRKIQSKDLRIISASVLLGFIAVTSPLLFLIGNAKRYTQDFFPALMILSYIALSFFYNKVASKRHKTLLAIVLILTLIYSFGQNALTTCMFCHIGKMERCLNIYNKEFIERS
ncbi:MAG: hypothetical protein A2X12_02195 [Bacteroidetes bacterium GWE2_29_8]|nr:MAG: hypothetical protein A2X12_02195 [Bacteroidetes bacterium GWE2_29_8]